MNEHLEEDEEERPHRRQQHMKKPKVMLRECEQYVHDGKRLPKLHSRWLLGVHRDNLSAWHSLELHYKYTQSLLKSAQERIKQLEQQLAEK